MADSARPRSTRIGGNYNSLDEVASALREAGLESSNLILGIDFTKSNLWTGRRSFHNKSLHSIGSGSGPNPYEQAISIIGRTLSPFDEHNPIPCFGFGDESTHGKHVFSFYPDHRPCHGFKEVLARYKEIVPLLNLAGPTSFGPIIHAAIDIVERNNNQYHVLVIIAGQVARNTDTPPGRLSPQQEIVNAVVAASQYPLSIILVGVGDGPWDAMQHFGDNIPQRSFDNFRFVNFTKIMSKNTESSQKETAFALAALKKIPNQYRATRSLNFDCRGHVGGPRTQPLPPPQKRTNFRRAEPTAPAAIPAAAPADVEPVCPICLTNPRDMAFECGHMTCKVCAVTISLCPLCREPITTRLRLYR